MAAESSNTIVNRLGSFEVRMNTPAGTAPLALVNSRIATKNDVPSIAKATTRTP